MERAHSRTRDEHTVTDSESHDHTDPLKHSDTQRAHNRFDPRPTDARGTFGDQTTHRRRSRTTRCQSAATDQGEAAPDSKEAALSEPNPAPSRSHTEHYITEHLPTCLQPTSARRRSTATAVRRADVRYHHWLDLESASITRADSVSPFTIGWNRLRFVFRIPSTDFCIPYGHLRNCICVDPVTCAHVTLTVWDR